MGGFDKWALGARKVIVKQPFWEENPSTFAALWIPAFAGMTG